MIVVDTSVWIDHLRSGDEDLVVLLNSSKVLMHPFVIGELACGNLCKRNDLLRLLADLPQALVVSQGEALHFVEVNRLMGQGIGFIDAHLLASTTLADRATIWTHDKRLRDVARKLKLVFE